MFACCDVKLYFTQVIIHYANIVELENTSICQQQQICELFTLNNLLKHYLNKQQLNVPKLHLNSWTFWGIPHLSIQGYIWKRLTIRTNYKNTYETLLN